MSSPAVKDLPTIANGLKGELEKDHQLKKTSVSSLYSWQNVFFQVSTRFYTQSLIIGTSCIRTAAEFLGKFKNRALGSSNLRTTSKNF